MEVKKNKIKIKSYFYIAFGGVIGKLIKKENDQRSYIVIIFI